MDRETRKRPAAAITGDRATKSRLRALCTLFLAELVLLIWFVRRDPLLEASIGSFLSLPTIVSAKDPAELFKHDPPIGFPLPNTGVAKLVRERARATSAGFLVVPIGDCASCIKADLPGWQRECMARGISLALITTASRATAAEFMKRSKLTAPYVLDPDGSMERLLNVVWYGRPYLFSPDWKLRWAPRRIGADPPFEDKEFLAALYGSRR